MDDRTRALIEAALVYAGGSHTVGDVEDLLDKGHAVLWKGPNSIVVTEIEVHPRQKVLHFFLASGNAQELEAMEEGIMQWGREQGCTKARFVGRRGWDRSFLARTGWQNTHVIVMEKVI